MKRPIAALAMPDVAPGPPTTPPPVFMMVRPAELLVNESYQRGLSDASIRLIRRIVAEFDWRKWKAPTVVETDEGFIVLDGQHSLIAAASHPDVDEVPVLVVEAPEQRAQAAAFVGINSNRLGITAAQLHHANVAAGDEAALAVDRVCVAAGVRVLRLPPARAVYRPGETIAIAAISGLVARQGEEAATTVLRILTGAAYGPIAAAHVRAVEELVTDEEFAELAADDIGRIVGSLGIEAAEKDAKLFASTHCVPLWRALAATWFKARKSTKRKAGEAGVAPGRHERPMEPGPAGPEARQEPVHPGSDRPREPAPPAVMPSRDAAVTRDAAKLPRSPANAAQVAGAKAAVPAPNFSFRRKP